MSLSVFPPYTCGAVEINLAVPPVDDAECKVLQAHSRQTHLSDGCLEETWTACVTDNLTFDSFLLSFFKEFVAW